MPKAGIEPARALTHYPLKIACLPVPPLRQLRWFHLAETEGLLNYIFNLVKKLLGVLNDESDAEIDEQAGAAHDLFDQALDFVGRVEKTFADLTTDLAVTRAIIGLKEESVRKFQ